MSRPMHPARAALLWERARDDLTVAIANTAQDMRDRERREAAGASTTSRSTTAPTSTEPVDLTAAARRASAADAPPAPPARATASPFWSAILTDVLEPPGPHARKCALEARRATSAAQGTLTPAKAQPTPSALRGAPTGGISFDWAPIVAGIIAERDAAPAAVADRQPQPEQRAVAPDANSEQLDMAAIARAVADPARTVERGPGRQGAAP